MSVTCSNEHDFLGMRIVFDKEQGTAKITMMSYLYEAINESSMHIARGAATPATRSLFELDPNSGRPTGPSNLGYVPQCCVQVAICGHSSQGGHPNYHFVPDNLPHLSGHQ